MTTTTIKLDGIDKVQARLTIAGAQAGKLLGRACHDEALLVFAESQRLVPHLEGTLMNSGVVGEPVLSAGSALVEFGYGGAAIDYAAVQHERTDFAHAPGRQAHYLSDPLERARGRFGDRVSARIAALLDGRLS